MFIRIDFFQKKSQKNHIRTTKYPIWTLRDVLNESRKLQPQKGRNRTIRKRFQKNLGRIKRRICSEIKTIFFVFSYL